MLKELMLKDGLFYEIQESGEAGKRITARIFSTHVVETRGIVLDLSRDLFISQSEDFHREHEEKIESLKEEEEKAGAEAFAICEEKSDYYACKATEECKFIFLKLPKKKLKR